MNTPKKKKEEGDLKDHINYQIGWIRILLQCHIRTSNICQELRCDGWTQMRVGWKPLCLDRDGSSFTRLGALETDKSNLVQEC